MLMWLPFRCWYYSFQILTYFSTLMTFEKTLLTFEKTLNVFAVYVLPPCIIRNGKHSPTTGKAAWSDFLTASLRTCGIVTGLSTQRHPDYTRRSLQKLILYGLIEQHWLITHSRTFLRVASLVIMIFQKNLPFSSNVLNR